MRHTTTPNNFLLHILNKTGIRKLIAWCIVVLQCIIILVSTYITSPPPTSLNQINGSGGGTDNYDLGGNVVNITNMNKNMHVYMKLEHHPAG